MCQNLLISTKKCRSANRGRRLHPLGNRGPTPRAQAGAGSMGADNPAGKRQACRLSSTFVAARAGDKIHIVLSLTQHLSEKITNCSSSEGESGHFWRWRCDGF